jgi:hypothetical protein
MGEPNPHPRVRISTAAGDFRRPTCMAAAQARSRRAGNPRGAPAPPSQAFASWRETPRRRCLQNKQIPVFAGRRRKLQAIFGPWTCPPCGQATARKPSLSNFARKFCSAGPQTALARAGLSIGSAFGPNLCAERER